MLVHQFFVLNIPMSSEWQYLSWWGGSKSASGMRMNMTSGAGNNIYRDTLPTGNWTQFILTARGWEYAPFRCVGKTMLATNANQTVEYIHLYIDITFPRQDGEFIDYFVKAVSFRITSPPTPITTSTSTSASTSTTSSSTPTLTSSSASNSGSNKLPVGSIVGGMIGAAIIAALIIVGACFYIERRREMGAQAAGHTGVQTSNPPMVGVGPQVGPKIRTSLV
ncbi:hypothetical protein FRB91_002894 [Serendipita sp. 411]|nr:hypothetical protein FRB91_002894 [Serendipita sp. 411]KAG9056299.1 hypothetical protein FS842_011091 [Serendipita sp. 407]